MIEAAAILFVALFVLGTWLVSRLPNRAAELDPVGERDRLLAYLAWLAERWQHAQTHGYDDEMKARIRAEIDLAEGQLAALRRRFTDGNGPAD